MTCPVSMRAGADDRNTTVLAMSTASRRKILDKLTDKDIWMLAAHFNTPTAAHVVSNGDRRRLKV